MGEYEVNKEAVKKAIESDQIRSNNSKKTGKMPDGSKENVNQGPGFHT